MKQHYFFTSVTRNADFSEAPFDVEPLDRSQWSTGDFVVGRVTGKRNRLYRCETRVGRMADMVRGDLMVGALGERAATLEGVGNWQAVGDDLEMEALTPAGLIGKATFVADKPGRFTFRCSETCGEFHPYMVGFMEVTPNSRFHLFVGIMCVAFVVVLGVLFKGTGENKGVEENVGTE